jgi:hypothetical protein
MNIGNRLRAIISPKRNRRKNALSWGLLVGRCTDSPSAKNSPKTFQGMKRFSMVKPPPKVAEAANPLPGWPVATNMKVRYAENPRTDANGRRRIRQDRGPGSLLNSPHAWTVVGTARNTPRGRTMGRQRSATAAPVHLLVRRQNIQTVVPKKKSDSVYGSDKKNAVGNARSQAVERDGGVAAATGPVTGPPGEARRADRMAAIRRNMTSPMMLAARLIAMAAQSVLKPRIARILISSG